MDGLADLFETVGPVIRIRTVPIRSTARYRHHLSRVRLVSVAIGRLLRARAVSTTALLSVDAGYGMCYTTTLAFVGRRLGYRLAFDHHSSAYISRQSRLMKALVRAAGESAIHIFKCEGVAKEFFRMYGPQLTMRTVGVAYAAACPQEESRARTASGERGLVLGHLSNLSVAKGLEIAVALARVAIDRGVASQLIIAGPVSGKRERTIVERAVAEGYAEYRGAVSGGSKDRFFRDIDVFVMPSRYKNELSPLVVWEAELRGVPVMAYRIGCLTESGVGKGSSDR